MKSLGEQGGHAFPTGEFYDEKQTGCDHGMSLRDYFAAKAMQALIANEAALRGLKTTAKFLDMDDDEMIAKRAYGIAEGMLKERAK